MGADVAFGLVSFPLPLPLSPCPPVRAASRVSLESEESWCHGGVTDKKLGARAFCRSLKHLGMMMLFMMMRDCNASTCFWYAFCNCFSFSNPFI